MANAILNKREKIKWDNAFQPDLVEDVNDYVSANIAEIIAERKAEVNGALNREHYVYNYKRETDADADSILLQNQVDGYRRLLITISNSENISEVGSRVNLTYTDLTTGTERTDTIVSWTAGTTRKTLCQCIACEDGLIGFSAVVLDTVPNELDIAPPRVFIKPRYAENFKDSDISITNIPVGTHVIIYAC